MNKIICFLISLLILFKLNSEVVGVPDYNYSVFPLEGWVLQPYENIDSLSWLSNDNSIAMSVTSFIGSTYDDIDYMFNNLSLEYNGSGNFVHFNYLNFQGAIGEILFDIGGKKFKGWVIFLNGVDFDYHLNAFTLEENYENAFNEIQSVLDSFSYGEKGPLNPGPISSFLEESPQRQFKTYTVDFFNQKISVIASDYDLTSSQSLIEREADIMQNYTLDPTNFYNAWKRYYQLIFRDNYSRFDSLYKEISPYIENGKYTDYELTELLMFWVQSFDFKRNGETLSDLLNPLEAALFRVGDCDARSLVLGLLLKKFGIESILLTSEIAKHAIIAVDIPGDGLNYKYNGKEYLEIELTKKALIGEIEESISNPNIWTPVEMGYTNGF